LDVEVLTFDFLGRGNPALRDAGLGGRGVTERRHRLLHRKAFNAACAYAPFLPAESLGLRGYDVLHSTYFERLPTPRYDAALVTTIYDVAFLRHPEWFPASNLAGSRRALQRQVDDSDVILAISEFTRRELIDLCGADPAKILVTPLASTSPPLDGPGPALPDRPYALYLGNLEPRKGVPDLVAAWQRSGLGTDFDLLLAGAPAYLSTESLDAVAGAADHNVRHLGYVDEPTKRRLLAGATCFVYPSKYEGFGIPVIEAMSYGLPVVTCDNSALAEVAGDAALLVPASDPTALGEAISSLFGDVGLASRLSKRGLARSAEFSWANTARLTRLGYERALSSR
jgi:glycosyltransferase involved in cell wall biosynthesis